MLVPRPNTPHIQSPERTLAIVALLAACGLWGIARKNEGEGVPETRLIFDANTATPALLSSLPGVGPKTTEAIVSERRRSPFRSIDDLETRVRGIGPVASRRIRPYLRFEDRTPGPANE